MNPFPHRSSRRLSRHSFKATADEEAQISPGRARSPLRAASVINTFWQASRSQIVTLNNFSNHPTP